MKIFICLHCEQMPREVKCQTCDGTGHEMEMGKEDCPECQGKGRDLTSECWMEPCRHCSGRGWRTYCRRSTKNCRSCNGRGTIIVG